MAKDNKLLEEIYGKVEPRSSYRIVFKTPILDRARDIVNDALIQAGPVSDFVWIEDNILEVSDVTMAIWQEMLSNLDRTTIPYKIEQQEDWMMEIASHPEEPEQEPEIDKSHLEPDAGVAMRITLHNGKTILAATCWFSVGAELCFTPMTSKYSVPPENRVSIASVYRIDAVMFRE